jgi:hypothetical protein
LVRVLVPDGVKHNEALSVEALGLARSTSSGIVDSCGRQTEKARTFVPKEAARPSFDIL